MADDTAWYKFNDHDLILCGECLNEDLRATKAGLLTGDEAVTMNMMHQLLDADTVPYQCDKCLTQNEAYEEGDWYA